MRNRIMVPNASKLFGNNLRNVVLKTVIFAIAALCLLSPDISHAADCSYFYEDFSSGKHNWSYTDSYWYDPGSWLLVAGAPPSPYPYYTYAYAEFLPTDFFYIDTDITFFDDSRSVGFSYYGIYPYTTLGVPLLANGALVNGVGAEIYKAAPNKYWVSLVGIDSLTGNYDVLSNPNSIVISSAPKSIGVAFTRDSAILRINGRNTSTKIAGGFSNIAVLIDAVSLMANGLENSFFDVSFDNICSGPISSSSGGGLEPPVLSYTLNADQLTLNWTPVSGAAGYRLYLGMQSGNYSLGSFDMGANTQVGPIDVSNRAAGTYYIAVKAYEGTNESGYSNEIALTKSALAPPVLSYMLDNDLLRISWTPVSGATGYKLYGGLQSGASLTYDMGNATQSNLVDVSGWTPGTYYYVATAYDNAAESNYSNGISFQINGAPVITSLSPNSGKPGDTVVILGYGFGDTQGGSSVTFAGTGAPDILGWSDTNIIVKVPQITSTADVVVTVDGRGSNGVTFTVINACSTQQVAGANTSETRVIDMGASHGQFGFDYQTYQVPDRMIVSYEGNVLFDTGCLGTNGTLSRDIWFSGTSTEITVEVQPNCTGTTDTGWVFTVHCPYTFDY